MAHVFYADKSPASDNKSSDGWSSQLKYVFKFMEWWNRYKIFNMFRGKSLFWLNAIGNIAGKLALKSRRGYQQILMDSYDALYPRSLSSVSKKKFCKAHKSYLGKLMFAFMGGLTLRKAPPSTDFARFQNLDILDRELSKNKGVIITLTHLGELTQAIWALVKHPKKYTVATVVYVPHMVIYKYANHSYYDHIYFYASTSFKKIGKHLESHLRQNHIVLIYYDFGHSGQYRIPFWYGKFPYLLHTPQSAIKLHKNTDAPILPCVNLPDGKIGKTLLKFLDNRNLSAISERYWNKNSSTFHGMISTELNKIYAPYLRAYAHVWEQITDFGGKRSSDKIIFPPNQPLKTIINLTISKMNAIIEGSFEPNRNDKTIKEKIIKLESILFSSLQYPETYFYSHKTYINLSKITAVSELQKIGTVLATAFKNHHEDSVSFSFLQFAKELEPFQTFSSK